MPTFSGRYEEWMSFKDLFISLIHSKCSLSSVQKLHYLKASLAGEAELLLRPYSITDDNYETAWRILEERYSNKRALLYAHFKRLFSQPSITTESSYSIRKLIDTSFESLKAIENLKIADLWAAVVAYFLIQKLPNETRSIWEQETANKREIPTLDELNKFLDNRFRALEAIADDRIKRRPVDSFNTNRQTHAVQTNLTVPQCNICNGAHSSMKCSEFLQATQPQRLDLVKRKGLCLNCLKRGHLIMQCPSKSSCIKCHRRHHTLLHRESTLTSGNALNSFPNNTNATTFQPTPSNLSATQTFSTAAPGEVLLASALVTLQAPNGRLGSYRALLDQGSQASFICESAVQPLGIKREATDINVFGFGGSAATKVTGKICVNLLTTDEELIPIQAFIVNKITRIIPSNIIELTIRNQLGNLRLADPQFDQPGKIDMLLGAEVYGKVILGDLLKLSLGPIVQNTKFGWVISGGIEPNKLDSVQNFSIAIDHNKELNRQLKQFWELEEIQTRKIVKKEDEQCEQHYTNTVVRNANGRYIVKLPFKNEISKTTLGESKKIAVMNLLHLERKLRKHPELAAQYKQCMREYIELGHMHRVEPRSEHTMKNGVKVCTTHYIPHHAVFKESTSTKLRVVFDASRKTSSGVALNDILLTGPTIQNKMISILMNWRLFKYAFLADIEKMYRQILIHSVDANYQRILWRSETTDPIEEYCLNTVTFGLTCAPFLAITVQQLAIDEGQHFPHAKHSVHNEMYVDDLLSGGITIDEAMQKRNDIDKMMQLGGFKLRKWIANYKRLLEDLPTEDIEMKEAIDLKLEQGYKSLGLIWYPLSDFFTYRIRHYELESPITKRNILSRIARLYDPMGWLAPIIIVGKIILQALWLHGQTWDEPVPIEIAHQWSKLQNNLNAVESIKVSRWMTNRPESKLEIHGFCDASKQAYAAAIYLVVRNTDHTQVNLIMAKTKVAPVRPITIPRLELCGAVLLAKLLKEVLATLKLSINDISLWTDSEIVLSWLKGHPTRWTTFVANRTAEIYELIGNVSWRHVPTSQNPADLASRGVSPLELAHNKLWWNGPIWLEKDTEFWPPQKLMEVTNLERRNQISVNLQTKHVDWMNFILQRFSTYTRLLRVTAYCFRFAANASKRDINQGPLTVQELQRAEDFWIKHIQLIKFPTEINSINQGVSIERGSRLLNLNPFIDGNGFLRVGGRLSNSDLSFEEKHPIIIPKDGRFTELLVHKFHQETLHGQIQLMLTTIRRKFWIINGRNIIKQCIHKCIKCFRATAKSSSQLMGSLPKPRVSISRPFLHTGVDYCGPFNIRDRRGRGAKIYKGYVAVFICLCTKAIHIEVVTAMTTEAFIAALRRFTGRRGLCSHIYSDCGTNFVGAAFELERIKYTLTAVAERIAVDGITWHFNPPASPHFGGLWEAGVKSLKQHLHRVLSDATLTYEEFTTVLVKIEACLNSRPLCPLNDDPNDTTALTPAHFLIGDTLLAPPEANIMDINVNRLDRWQLTERLTQTFWNRWHTEYLSRLQSRPKWLHQQRNPKIGDLCLIKDERYPSYKWALARITNIYPGKDGNVRVVSVKNKNNEYKRPISKIALLPINTVSNETA